MTDQTRIFTDPTPSEAKYLIPFEIGEQKILLYGAPTIMSLRSNLIASLLDKLDKGPNILAPKISAPKEALLYIWYELNRFHAEFPRGYEEDVWELLNYFDVPIQDKLITNFVNMFAKHFPTYYAENDYKEFMDNMLTKIKVFDSVGYGIISNKLNHYREKNARPIIVKVHHPVKGLLEFKGTWGDLDNIFEDKLKGKFFGNKEDDTKDYWLIDGFKFPVSTWIDIDGVLVTNMRPITKAY